MALKRCPNVALSHCFWSWCVVSRRSNRVILFQILLVHVHVSQWRIACPPTLFLAFPLAAAVFLIFRWYSRELFVHSIWLIFQFPLCCSPYVFSIGLCFPWIFFNMRWTICLWNYNFLMNVFSTLSVFSSACSWIPSNILSLPLIDLVWRPIWRSFNHFTSPLSVCTLSTISLFLFMIWLVCSLMSVIFSLITLTSFFYSVSIHKSHTLAISRTFAFMFWTSLFTVRIFHSRAWGLNGTH